MTFNDIFKSSFLEQVTSFSFTDMVISLALAFAIGLFIFEIYKITYRGVMYSRSFGLTLLALAMITDLAIMTVTSNVVLSLGMVGALSIVRFRTAIKEPLDIAFLFWSIVVGIMLGAGMIPLAVFGSLILGLIFYLFTRQKRNTVPYILVSALAFLRMITPEQAQFARDFAAPSAERFDNALRWIETLYGSVQNYLSRELGIGTAESRQLQALYLKETSL